MTVDMSLPTTNRFMIMSCLATVTPGALPCANKEHASPAQHELLGSSFASILW